jgi:hypothetical protein
MARVPLPKTSNVTYTHIDELDFLCMQCPLHTLMVFDDWMNRVPMAYITTSTSKQLDLKPWMKAMSTNSIN